MQLNQLGNVLQKYGFENKKEIIKHYKRFQKSAGSQICHVFVLALGFFYTAAIDQGGQPDAKKFMDEFDDFHYPRYIAEDIKQGFRQFRRADMVKEIFKIFDIIPDQKKNLFLSVLFQYGGQSKTIQKQLGQYFTPPLLTQKAAEFFNQFDFLDFCDPCFGSGLMFFDLIKSRQSKPLKLYGCELDRNIYRTTLVQLHQIDIEHIKNLENCDAVNYTQNHRDKFGAVFCNPPYSTKITKGSEEIDSVPFFCTESIGMLKPGGVGVFVVAADGIFCSKKGIKFRKFFTDNCKISGFSRFSDFPDFIGTQQNILLIKFIKKTNINEEQTSPIMYEYNNQGATFINFQDFKARDFEFFNLNNFTKYIPHFQSLADHIELGEVGAKQYKEKTYQKPTIKLNQCRNLYQIKPTSGKLDPRFLKILLKSQPDAFDQFTFSNFCRRVGNSALRNVCCFFPDLEQQQQDINKYKELKKQVKQATEQLNKFKNDINALKLLRY